MMKLFPYLTIFGLLLLSSCNYLEEEPVPLEEEEPVLNVQSYPGVDEALWPYFTRFEEEARLRGIEVDLVGNAITGVIEELSEDQVAGQCNYNSHHPNHVTIDQSFWQSASDRYREFVVFHELGHCELLRDHREAAHADGSCKSLMRSGAGDCVDNYHPFSRPDYLDELFDPQFRGDWIGG